MRVIYETLAEAGIVCDEGPGMGGDCGPYIQSERAAIYKEYAEKLVALGGAYYCFCDKARLDSLKDANGVGRYDKHCLRLTKEEVAAKLAAGEPYVIWSPRGTSARRSSTTSRFWAGTPATTAKR